MATRTPSRSRKKSTSASRRGRQSRRTSDNRKTKSTRRTKRTTAEPAPVSPALRRKLKKLGTRWEIILPRLRASERLRSRVRQ